MLLSSLLALSAVTGAVISGAVISGEYPACKMLGAELERTACDAVDGDSCPFISSRLIVIGDVHGSAKGMQEVLYKANITTGLTSCSWTEQPFPTILLQIGDIVDRGLKTFRHLLFL